VPLLRIRPRPHEPASRRHLPARSDAAFFALVTVLTSMDPALASNQLRAYRHDDYGRDGYRSWAVMPEA